MSNFYTSKVIVEMLISHQFQDAERAADNILRNALNFPAVSDLKITSVEIITVPKGEKHD